MEKTDFRKDLKKLIAAKKISIAQLARDADLSYGTVYCYLKGYTAITSGNLAKLFDILNSAN